MSIVPYTSMKDPEEILEIFLNRQLYYGKHIARMRGIQTLMNNEMDVPLPELNENERSLVANLALRGMEQLSQRIASVEPMLYFPSTRAGSDAADARARDRKRVMMGWHESNDMFRIRSLRARHFLSWATSPVVIRPDPHTRLPVWDVRRPLESFPPPGTYDDMLPLDLITADVYSYQQLIELFGRDAIYEVTKPPNWNWDDDTKNYGIEFEVLEYIDDREISMILCGHSPDPSAYRRHQPNMRGAIRLRYAPNLVGRPLVVQPGRICLDEQLGYYDGIIGMYQARAALMALMVIGQRKAVWPREWVEALPNSPEEPEVTQDPDQYRGIPGIIANGRMNQQNLDPSFRALEIIDRQEESERKESGIPSEMLGSSRTHVSARRGAQVMGATIDFTIAEAQNIFARSLKEEDKLAIAVDKAYFPKSKTFYLETRSYIGHVNYTPSTLWETDSHIVEYPLVGTDLQNLPIEGGQRVQMETLSREGFMEIDPIIKDVDAELLRMDREALKRAFQVMVQTVASNPDPNAGIQPRHIAEIDELVAAGTPLLKAFIQVDDKIKAEQAAMQQQMMAMQAGQMAGPPGAEGQPGTATPGAAGTAAGGVGPIPQPPDSMARFTQLLGSLGTAQTAGRFRNG